MVHIDETNKHLYFAKKYCDSTEYIQFNPSAGQTTYSGSIIHEKCKQFYANKIPEEYKTSGILLTTTEAIDCPVFIPTLAQVASTTIGSNNYYRGSGEWSYFADDESRKFKDTSGTKRVWWLQSQWPNSPSSYVCFVNSDGGVTRYNTNGTNGFRPCFCMDISSLYIAKQASILQELFGS